MDQEDARKILALHAVERSDESESILTTTDKREAAAAAGAPLPKRCGRAQGDAFLAARADALLARVAARFPAAAEWTIRPAAERHRFGALAFGLLALAPALGFLTNELGPEKRINILSFPLLGIILWSLLVYLREIWLFFRRRDRLFRDGWVDWLARFAHPPSTPPAAGKEESPGDSGKGETALPGARVVFESRWRRLTAPVTGARIKALLHLVALVLAGAAILGMYVKGLANEYRAVWESTFFTDGAQLRPFLEVVLGPAAAATGDAIPSESALARMHWQADATDVAGENAGRWIHWYAITVAIYVLIPRALLAISWRLRAARLARSLPYREVDPSWFDHLVAVSSGSALEVTVAPYVLRPDEERRRAVQHRLEEHFRRPLEIDWATTIAFGEEDEPTVSPGEGPDSAVIPLFDFAATPERETHHELYRALSGGSRDGGNLVLLDTTAFDRKASGFPDAEQRRAGREAAWRRLFETDGAELLFVSTTATEPTRAAE